MRLKLTLKQAKPRQLIPSEYHYAISSFIYRTIERSDADYSEWLHSKGYADGKKKFKFFNFSDFFIPERRFTVPGKIEIISEYITLYISMLGDKSMEHLIIGMFNSGIMKIFDTTTEAGFSVKYIETVPEPEFKERMRFRSLTPAVFSKKVNLNGKDKTYYLEPSDPDYNIYFVRNILEKYKIYSGIEIADPQNKFEINLLSDFKKDLRTIKSDGKTDLKIRGYRYDFEIKAPTEIQKMLWMSGIGIKNSMGFGFVSTIRN
jgi:CRISPR-associated endoribonuclease Cas6